MMNPSACREPALYIDPRLERRLRRTRAANRSVEIDDASTKKRGANPGKRVPDFVRCENFSSSNREESCLHGNGFDRSENDVNEVGHGDVQDLRGDTFLKIPTGIEDSRAVMSFPASDSPETLEIAPIRSVNPNANRGKRLRRELSDLIKSNAPKIEANYSSAEVVLSGRVLRSRARKERNDNSGTLGDYDVPVKRRKASSAKKIARRSDVYDDEVCEVYLGLVNSSFGRNDLDNTAEEYIKILNPDGAVPRSDSGGSGEGMLEVNPGANDDRTVDVESDETDNVDLEESRGYLNYMGRAGEGRTRNLDSVEGNDNVDPEETTEYLNYTDPSASRELVLYIDSRLERRLRRTCAANLSVKSDNASTAKRGAKPGKRVSDFVQCENISSSNREESGSHGNGFDRSENDVNEVGYGDVQDLRGDTFLKIPTGIDDSRAVMCFPASDSPETPEIAPICSVNPNANRGKRLRRELSDLIKSNVLKIGADYSIAEVVLNGRVLRSRARNERNDNSGTLGVYDVPVKRRRASSAKKKARQSDVHDDEVCEVYLGLVNSFFGRNDLDNRAEEYIKFFNPDGVVPISDRDGSSEGMPEANPGANDDRTIDVESDETDNVDSEESREYLNHIRRASEGRTRNLDIVEGNDNVEPEETAEYLNYIRMAGEGRTRNLDSVEGNDNVDLEETGEYLNYIRTASECRPRNLHSVDGNDNVDPEETAEYLNYMRTAREGRTRNLHGVDGNDNVDPEETAEYLNHIGTAGQDGIGKVDNVEGNDNVEPEETTQYLNYIRLAGEDGIGKHNGGPCRATNVEGDDSDSDIVVLDHDPFHCEDSTLFKTNQTAFVDLESDNPDKNLGMTSHQFEEFTEILKRPYDAEQHTNYLQLAQRRTPVLEDLNLRGGRFKIVKSATRMGKSYLDHHTDLAELIDLAKDDKLKSLNLLRAFFFWLEKLTTGSILPPWKDPSVLKVLSQPSFGKLGQANMN